MSNPVIAPAWNAASCSVPGVGVRFCGPFNEPRDVDSRTGTYGGTGVEHAKGHVFRKQLFDVNDQSIAAKSEGFIV